MQPETIALASPVVAAVPKPNAKPAYQPPAENVVAPAPLTQQSGTAHQLFAVSVARFFATGCCVLAQNINTMPENLLMASIAGCFNYNRNIERYHNKIHLRLSSDSIKQIQNNNNQVAFDLLNPQEISVVTDGVITKINTIFTKNQDNKQDVLTPFYIFIMGQDLVPLAELFPQKINNVEIQIIKCLAPAKYIANSEPNNSLNDLRIKLSQLSQFSPPLQH